MNFLVKFKGCPENVVTKIENCFCIPLNFFHFMCQPIFKSIKDILKYPFIRLGSFCYNNFVSGACSSTPFHFGNSHDNLFFCFFFHHDIMSFKDLISTGCKNIIFLMIQPIVLVKNMGNGSRWLTFSFC